MTKTIAFLPARGGSKSIPLKNIRPFCGKPLIYWSLRALQETGEIDEIYVATDSEKIAETVSGFRFSKVRIFERSSENARDHSTTESVMTEFIKSKQLRDEDIFILVQATMPLVRAEDISGGLRLRRETGSESILSCARVKLFIWDDHGNPVNYDFRNRPRRQDFEGNLMENGSFYINTAGDIMRTGNRLSGKISVYEMEPYTSIDIDDEDDWIVAEKLMRKYILTRAPEKNIKVFFTDVDGTLTDSGMYYGDNGEVLKKFSTRDGKGFELLRKAGIKTGIITSEQTTIVEQRAKKIKADFLYQGIADKLETIENFCSVNNISLDEIAYIGDDINDLDLLSQAGLAACPADSSDKVKAIPGIKVLACEGGKGAVREFIDNYILTPKQA